MRIQVRIEKPCPKPSPLTHSLVGNIRPTGLRVHGATNAGHPSVDIVISQMRSAGAKRRTLALEENCNSRGQKYVPTSTMSVLLHWV